MTVPAEPTPVQPFATGAPAYAAAGFTGVIPVRSDKKAPAMQGVTGHSGVQTTPDQYASAHAVGQYGVCNLAWRMPAGLIGIDVDAYDRKRGDDTFAALTLEYGPLPATYRSSARPGDPVSGIRFFRVPETYTASGVLPATQPDGTVTADVEVVQHHHRFAVVWPSVHHTGGVYRWYAPDGSLMDEGSVPDVLLIPELPAAWADAVATAHRDRVAGLGVAVAAFEEGCAGNSQPRALDHVRASFSVVAGSRHDTMYKALCWAAREAAAGLFPAAHAFSCLRSDWNAATDGEDRTVEFDGMLSDACAAVSREDVGRVHERSAAFEAAPLTPFDPEADGPFCAATLQAAADACPDPVERRIAAASLVRRAAADTSAPPGLRDDLRARLKSLFGLPLREFDSLWTSEVRVQAERARAERIRALEGEGRIMPGPGKPLEAAHHLYESLALVDGVRPLVHWRGDWYTWNGVVWSQRSAAAMCDWLYPSLRRAKFLEPPKNGGPLQERDWDPTAGKLDVLTHALSSVARRPDEEEADTGLAFRNGYLSRIAGSAVLEPHTAARFVTAVMPVDYDPDAVAPSWLTFLLSLPPASRLRLQELTGYLISGRCDLEKIGFLYGPPRCGKGTWEGAVHQIMGNRSGPADLADMGTHFGLASLIPLSVAIMPDVRFNVAGAVDAVPRLLTVSSADTVVVPRKHKESWQGVLPTRLVMLSNDPPALPDRAGALAARLVVIPFTESFVGREDTTLKKRLRGELSGILNWALEGLERLERQGSFTPDESAQDVIEDAAHQSFHELGFVETACMADPDAVTTTDELFQAWQAYRLDEGLTRYQPSKRQFAKNLRQAYARQYGGKYPPLTDTQRAVGPKRLRAVRGLRLVEHGRVAQGSFTVPVFS